MSKARTNARREQLARLRTSLAVEVSEELLDLALTHRSFAYEHGGVPDNERLEFLGDSVLGIVERSARAATTSPRSWPTALKQ